jgi:carboxyl-terminal processing protease
MKKSTLALLIFSFTNLYSQITIADKDYNKLITTLNYIDQFYIEKVDKSEIVDKAIVSILKDLDPHSVYVSKEEVQEMNEPLIGNFEGVGIQFNILDDTIYVVATIAGGPSEKVGILPGDKIITINGEVVAGVQVTNKMVMERLRGVKGTEVKIEVKRNGAKRLLDFNITRDKIPLYSVDAAYMAKPGIGYIKVNRFAAQTSKEFKEALEKLKLEGMKSLILDLQGNSGGYLNATFQMVDELLDSGKMIVYTEGANSPMNPMKSTSYGNFKEGNVVILVDQYSASASEIMAGAVQDLDRGLIIGRRTYGKGLVQRPITLPDGAQIRLTIAHYFTPSGRSIQRPYDKGIDEYRKDISNRFESGELTDSIKLNFPDSLKFSTNKGRIVYGGGGIIPDIFIPLDTSSITDYYSEIRRKGLLNKFSLYYVDKNRASLKEFYSNVEMFNKNFDEMGEFLQEFVDFAVKEGIEKSEEDLAKSSKLIAIQLKSLIARNLFNGEAFYYIYNPQLDPAYIKALEVIEKNLFKKYNIN